MNNTQHYILCLMVNIFGIYSSYPHAVDKSVDVITLILRLIMVYYYRHRYDEPRICLTQSIRG